MNLLVTGGCGFIGSNFIHHVINRRAIHKLINLDLLTYAGDLKNVTEIARNPKYSFCHIDLANSKDVREVFLKHSITHVVHFAAESHVDNSISGPLPFINANVLGTFNLLESSKEFQIKRFHHVSTDEVYGALGKTGKFNENTPYHPHNPYSATKAASDMLVRAYGHTYDFKYTLSNCSNNYGPRQHSEKFLPVVINSILNKRKIPVYGSGKNVRDWIYVIDHCEAVWTILTKGKDKETYLVGSDCEKTNLELINGVCHILGVTPDEHISFIEDRKGHDFRYAIDNSKIKKELKWEPKFSFREGLSKTILFYESKFSKNI